MFRICYSATPTEQRWILCGQLTGRSVEELRTSWGEGLIISRDTPRIVDLTDVTFVDESGETLLRELEAEGAEFVGDCGVETRYLIENLRAGGSGMVRKHLACPE
ncbi:MAG TPA: hypothetical protein VGL72_11705 [Bryobacteraceae bacterium]|jgi:hypothetical protein